MCTNEINNYTSTVHWYHFVADILDSKINFIHNTNLLMAGILPHFTRKGVMILIIIIATFR